MAQLWLSLLGPLQITLDGQPVSGFAYNKARALLAYLAVEADRPHHRDGLVGLLWPELPDTAARTNLRQALANLREAIGDATATPPFLLITRDTIQFNPASDYELDVAAFVALLAACVTHAHRDLERCRSCAARMEQAIALYHGDFLAGFSVADSAPFEEWQLRQHERLHQRALDALAHLADYHERRGDDERARRNAQRQIELEPWREEAYRLLMRLLARAGQRSAALAQYETCRHILARDLGVEPEAETTALYERIRDTTSAELAAHRDEARHVQNFPAQTTALIGRESELAELGTLLENPACRLITIVGPGGIGKTRLALGAGIDQAEAFADGAAFVPLQAISAAAFVAPAILGALGVTLQGQREPREQLLDYLRKKELLLVLDNFEHLIGAASLVGNLLAAAPQLTVLITSRSVLRLSGEHEYDVPPLTLPGEQHLRDLTALARVPAVDLFVQRSQMVKADFRLNEENAAAVAAICQRLDGLPLAIELAAARIKLFKPATLLARLDQRLTLLTDGPRDLPARQQTLRAALDWSYNLLEEADKTLFARLGVFVGGWTLEAAEAVCAGVGGWESGAGVAPLTLNSQSPTPVLDGLVRLIDHNLVRQDASAHGEDRFAMLETIREYALERLAASGDEHALRQQHMAYFTALVERVEPEFRGPQACAWMDSLETDLPNLRAALIWSQAAPDRAEFGLRLASAMLWFWDQRSVAEGDYWLKRVLSRPEAAMTTAARTKALTAACYFAHTVAGDYDRAQALGQEAIVLARELKDPARTAWALCLLGALLQILPGQRIHGMALLEESLILFKEIEDEFGIARALMSLGDGTYHEGDTARSMVLLEKSLERFRALGDRSGAADPLWILGNIALEQGNAEHAVALYEESLALCREAGDRWGVAYSLRQLSRAELELGNLERTAALLAESITIFRDQGAKREVPWVHNDIGTLARLRCRYAQAAACYSESLALFMELGNQNGIATVRYNQGFLAYTQGDDTRATPLLREGLALSQALQRPADIARCLTGLVGIVARCRRLTDAAHLLGAAESLLVLGGNRRDFAARADYQHIITAIRSQLDEATFATAWAEGRAMPLDQAIAYALEIVRSEAVERGGATSATP